MPQKLCAALKNLRENKQFAETLVPTTPCLHRSLP